MYEGLYKLDNYSYDLPAALIAQEPASPRDSSRLLVVNRSSQSFEETIFRDIVSFFKAGDVMVLNNTEVIKARLKGVTQSGSKIDVLLLREKEKGVWEVLMKPGKRCRAAAAAGKDIIFDSEKLKARIIDTTEAGTRILRFEPADIEKLLPELGDVPLPPYIKKRLQDPRDYQTIYASKKGAVAAPTAGFHFTSDLLDKLKSKGVEMAWLTLHCGLPTFRPVKTDDIRDHRIDCEWIDISPSVSQTINSAKQQKRRVIAVGTTTVRALESAAIVDARGEAALRPIQTHTNLYLVPGYTFKIVDALITNFHTPCSTNLILVAAFCGLELTKRCYSYAKERNFRFFSFGDAMFIYGYLL